MQLHHYSHCNAMFLYYPVSIQFAWNFSVYNQLRARARTRARTHARTHTHIIIIIIIIIWHYNPLWVFAFSARSLRVLLSLAVSFQFLTFSFFRSCYKFCSLHPFTLPSSFSKYPTSYTWLRFHSKICLSRIASTAHIQMLKLPAQYRHSVHD